MVGFIDRLQAILHRTIAASFAQAVQRQGCHKRDAGLPSGKLAKRPKILDAISLACGKKAR
jgi:hypothetical protein